MPIVKHISDSQLKTLPSFKPGDTVKVHQRIKEGGKERVQMFEGLVIARKGGTGANGTFMVRKISYGEGVERVFPLYSPNITVEVKRHGDVRRAKLYYLRGRTGKSARIAERPRDVTTTASSSEKEAAE